MPVVKFLAKDKVQEYLDGEVRNALVANNLLSLSGFAWVDSDTPNPDYSGLAIWELDPPRSTVTDSQFSALTQPKQERLNSITTISEDMRGLMELSRIAIGHALFRPSEVRSF